MLRDHLLGDLVAVHLHSPVVVGRYRPGFEILQQGVTDLVDIARDRAVFHHFFIVRPEIFADVIGRQVHQLRNKIFFFALHQVQLHRALEIEIERLPGGRHHRHAGEGVNGEIGGGGGRIMHGVAEIEMKTLVGQFLRQVKIEHRLLAGDGNLIQLAVFPFKHPRILQHLEILSHQHTGIASRQHPGNHRMLRMFPDHQFDRIAIFQ